MAEPEITPKKAKPALLRKMKLIVDAASNAGSRTAGRANRLTPLQVLVLIHILDRINVETDVSRQGIDTLARRVGGASRRAIIVACDRLVEMRYLTAARRRGGKGVANHFTLGDKDVSVDMTGGPICDTEGVEADNTNGDPAITLVPHETMTDGSPLEHETVTHDAPNVDPRRPQTLTRGSPELDRREFDSEFERKKVGASAAPGVVGDVEVALEAWNGLAHAHGLSAAVRLHEERRKQLAARLRDCGGIDGWSEVLAKVGDSPFLKGENDRGWRVTLDWLLKPANLTKVMENAYQKGPPPAAGNGYFAVLRQLDAEAPKSTGAAYLSALAELESSDRATWESRADQFLTHARWLASWGPEPGFGGCGLPPDLLAKCLAPPPATLARAGGGGDR